MTRTDHIAAPSAAIQGDSTERSGCEATSAQALREKAEEVKRLAYLMSEQDVSAATANSGISRQAFEIARVTAKTFERTVDELIAALGASDHSPEALRTDSQQQGAQP